MEVVKRSVATTEKIILCCPRVAKLVRTKSSTTLNSGQDKYETLFLNQGRLYD
jgi:hypothetical protein